MNQNEIDFFIMNDICPLCKKDLEVKQKVDKHGDNMLFYEYIMIKTCPTHGDMEEIEDLIKLEEKNADL